jgi:hypothetical protein
VSLAPRNPHLLDRLQLFAVARPETCAHFDPRPFGLEVAAVLDPLHRSSAPFLELLKRLDEVTFGPEGMPMPRWVYLDGAEMTGGIVGFGMPADAIAPAARELLAVPDDYEGLVPYAVYIAIPTFEDGVWFGHNLASVASLLPDEELAGLGSLTKAVALRMLAARAQIGATQWHSLALFVHCRLGPLELLSASTPAHGDADTLTYRVAISDAALRHLARDPAGRVDLPDPDRWIDSADHAAMRQLQAELEAGARFAIVGRPRRAGDCQSVPLRRLD